jgi:succinate dehydrogenase flavin-adding protein (antitoxin of CptAB toxin-antitoxin module)
VEDNKNFKSLMEQDFKEKILSAMKENLIFSLISFLFAKVMDHNNEIDKKAFEKEFISFWKKSINEITQNQLANINKILNENNIDMLNIISGQNNLADVEDYQHIINDSIKEVENIFWKICGEDLK